MKVGQTDRNASRPGRRALYRHSAKVLVRQAAPYWRGSRRGLRRVVRHYLRSHRRDLGFLRSIVGSVTKAAFVATLVLQFYANPAQGQPSFSSSAPANATHATAVGSNLSTTFSQAIAAGTVSSATFVVHGGMTGMHGTGGTASTHRDGTYTGQGTTTLTFNPGANLKPGELVQMTLTTGLQNGSAQALTAAKVVQFRAAATGGPAVFSNASYDFGSASDPTYAISLGDLDADGDLDIIAGSSSMANQVYLGYGNGTFAAGSDVDTPTNTTRSGALGDVDGDGDLDFVAGNTSQANRVYLSNGNGTFASGNDLNAATNATRDIALGDMDGDGDFDFVEGNYNQTNRIYLGNGDGTFGASNNVDTPTNKTLDVTIGDVDNDGDLDLVSGNYNQRNRVYLSNGDGTFAVGSDIDTPTQKTHDLSLGDVDGDGDLDVVVGDRTQVNLVHLGNGDGTFVAGSNIAATTLQTQKALLGDIDGDGDLDVVTANSNAGGVKRFYLGNGDGTFAAGSDLDASVNGSVSAALGDLDGDGDLDFVVGNTSGNQIFLNSNTTFSSSSPTVNVNNTATTSNISATFSQSMQAATSSTFVVHGGFTGKRAGSYSGASSTTLSFDPSSDLRVGELVEVTLKAGLKSTSGDALQPAKVYRFRAAASSGPAVFNVSSNDLDTSTSATQGISLGDLDGDGDLDLVTGNYNAANRVYLGTGSGTFATGNDVDTPANKTRPVVLGDLDGDGDLDLVAGNDSQANRVYLGTGSGTFATGNDVDTPTNRSRAITLGDLDGDGDLDLVAGNQSEKNRVYLGNGNGTFATGNDVDTPANATLGVVLGDLDGDGDLDLVSGNFNQVNRVYLGNGNGTFATGNDVDTPTNSTLPVQLGDLDGDGDLDLVAGNQGQANRVYLGNGNGTFATGNDVDTPANRTRALLLGDMDGDGDLDIVTGNGNAAQINRFYLSNGDGTFATGSDIDTPVNNTIFMSLGDMDGDGDLDIVTGNSGQVNRVYLNLVPDSDATLAASATLDESSSIALPSTADTQAEAVDLFDFKLTDGGGSDGLALGVSQVVLNTSGTGPFSQVTWLLNGPDASNISGTYNSGTNKITFSGLSISVANGANETYTVRGYYNNTTGLTQNQTFILSIDGDTDVTVSGSSTTMATTTAVSNNSGATTSIPPTLISNGLGLNENSTATLSSTQLNATHSAQSDPDKLTYTLTRLPARGQLFKSDQLLGVGTTFTQSDIDNGRLTYTHHGAEANTDDFAFSVAADIGIATQGSFGLSIQSTNDSPQVNTSRTLFVYEGQTETIYNGNLRVIDLEQLPTQLAFTVISLPAHGQLNLTSFTQDDIDHNRLTYTHNGNEESSDSFTFTVSDGIGGTLGQTTFPIQIRPLNDAPVASALADQQLAEGEVLSLDLGISDPEDNPLDLTFVSLPTGAEVTGTTLNWVPTFEQAGTYPLDLTATDDQGGTTRVQFTLVVTEAEPPPLVPEPALLEFGAVHTGEMVEQTFTLPNPTNLPLNFETFTASTAGFSVVNPLPPFSVAPNTQAKVTLRYAPEPGVLEPVQATLTAVSPIGPLVVPVSGQSLWSGVAFDTESLIFSEVHIGDVAEQSLEIRNPGNEPLEVEALTLSDPLFLSTTPSPFTIAAGEQQQVVITFAPETAGLVTGTLRLETSAGPQEILLTGMGIYSGQPADFDRDGSIGFTDFFLLADVFGQSVPPADPRFDLDNDGLIAFVDFFFFAEQFERQGESSAKLFALAEQMLGLPQAFELRPNYPNPFNPETTLPYVLAVDSAVSLSIYDSAGQQVRQLVNQEQSAGIYEIRWDGRDEAGLAVGNGVYLVRLIAGTSAQTRKILLLK